MHAHALLSTAKSTQSAAGLGHPSLSMVVLSSMAWCIVPPTSTTAANMIKLAVMYLSSLVMVLVCRGGDHQRQRGRDAAAVAAGRIRECHQREAREQPRRQRHVVVVVAQLLAAHAQGGGEGREPSVAGEVLSFASPRGSHIFLGFMNPAMESTQLSGESHSNLARRRPLPKLLCVNWEVLEVQFQKEGALKRIWRIVLPSSAGVQQLKCLVTGHVLWLDLVPVPPCRQFEVLPGMRVHWEILVSGRVCAFGQDELEKELTAEELTAEELTAVLLCRR
eukprot:scaffold7517_cov64-Phaeocystis_antarctica.AAC.1